MRHRSRKEKIRLDFYQNGSLVGSINTTFTGSDLFGDDSLNQWLIYEENNFLYELLAGTSFSGFLKCEADGFNGPVIQEFLNPVFTRDRWENKDSLVITSKKR